MNSKSYGGVQGLSGLTKRTSLYYNVCKMNCKSYRGVQGLVTILRELLEIILMCLLQFFVNMSEIKKKKINFKIVLQLFPTNMSISF